MSGDFDSILSSSESSQSTNRSSGRSDRRSRSRFTEFKQLSWITSRYKQEGAQKSTRAMLMIGGLCSLHLTILDLLGIPMHSGCLFVVGNRSPSKFAQLEVTTLPHRRVLLPVPPNRKHLVLLVTVVTCGAVPVIALILVLLIVGMLWYLWARSKGRMEKTTDKQMPISFTIRSYFIISNELTIKANAPLLEDASSENDRTSGQTVAIAVIVLQLIEIYRSVKAVWRALSGKGAVEDEKAAQIKSWLETIREEIHCSCPKGSSKAK
ncbi:hypothetical protein C8J56DRAFT_1055607 [Mycena floridula]|nr:hypothetical protein C8J56DRAFT_1055607 [Mycena floridula]